MAQYSQHIQRAKTDLELSFKLTSHEGRVESALQAQASALLAIAEQLRLMHEETGERPF